MHSGNIHCNTNFELPAAVMLVVTPAVRFF